MGQSAGAVQVRECATALLHVAKQARIPIFLIGHVTKVWTHPFTQLRSCCECIMEDAHSLYSD